MQIGGWLRRRNLPVKTISLAEVLAAVAAGKLDPDKLQWKSGASACVVLASGGYPGKFETGKVISGLSEAEQVEAVKVARAMRL
jgi:phosphoribosylamine--glycine ligase